MMHQKGQRGVVMSWKFVHQFVELLQTGCRCVGRRTRPLSGHSDEIRIESRREQSFGQLTQIKFQHVGHDIGMNVRQIDKICSVFK